MEELLSYMRRIRRSLHRHPELAFEERQTAALICRELDTLGIPARGGVAGTGIVAVLKKGDGPVVALRADMDALPVQECTGLVFASEVPGKMHACGHDGHVAALLGAARLLQKRNFCGEVRLFFQPAEENGNGADKMVRAGVMEGVNAVFGGHLDIHFPPDCITLDEGPICSFADPFDIHLTGHGGHAARPQEARDCVVAGATLIQALQTVVSRESDPNTAAVITVGEFHAGTVRNAIAGEAVLRGTVRTTWPEVRERVLAAVKRVVKGSAALSGVDAHLEWGEAMPAVINQEWGVRLGRLAAKEIGVDVCSQGPPSLGGEDFAFYLQGGMRGCFVRFGAALESGSGVAHSGSFDFDEAALETGARWLAEVAVQGLRECGREKVVS
jgi:hippurate hydrolase